MGTQLLFGLFSVLFAASLGQTLIHIILIVGLIALAWYGITAIGIPAPWSRILQIVLVIVAIILAIRLLLRLFGDPQI